LEIFYRPIAGHANLCPGSISTKRQELDILLSTVKHEMLHALGFSVSLFAFYRDSAGRPLTPRGIFFSKINFRKMDQIILPLADFQATHEIDSWYFQNLLGLGLRETFQNLSSFKLSE
jgi:hypothetical protein